MSEKVYSMIMPPPNVTGVLHMGHMLNDTIQDVLVRYHKNKGFNTFWIPGLDHAAIATENKVIDYLKKEKNIEKKNITREEFLKYCWEWKEKYGNTIIEQIKGLNCLVDWDKLHFTLDKDVSDLVKDTFIKMFNEGLIYKSNKIINWDCKNKTALSDEEVLFRDCDSVLYYLKYKFIDSEEYLTIATSRPETIFGDSAICVNPTDERYNKYIGKKVLIPIINREIEIIGDEYVDKDFGTGCLKVTPCHDFNDYELGLKHNLEFINILNADGTLNENCGEFYGLDKAIAKKQVKLKLQELDLLEKEERYKTRIGFSERTNTIVEPRMSSQWFIKMKDLAEPALKLVLEGRIKFHPERFVNNYKSWLENINDWCISRQLYWGHRIPVFYHGDEMVAAHDIEEASKLLNCDINDIKQDEDVLDTWFSAALWPIVCTDGDNLELPTDDLVTGPDIIFFWVARMIIMTYYLTGKAPFKNVYFTGIIRDNIGRKMSKSLGNSPDTLHLIEQYGSDGVRLGLMLTTQAGNDLRFNEGLCKQGRNFITKLRNARRLLDIWAGNVGGVDLEEAKKEYKRGHCMHKDLINALYKDVEDVLMEVDKAFSEYKINDAAMILYRFVWDVFCSKYLEAAKPKNKYKKNKIVRLFYGLLNSLLRIFRIRSNNSIDKTTVGMFFHIFNKLLVALEPFIPNTCNELRTYGKDNILCDKI